MNRLRTRTASPKRATGIAALAAITVLVTLVAGLAGCRSSREREKRPEWAELISSDMGEMPNVSVSGNLWFGGQPKPEDLELADRRGIETVIDVCTEQERKDENLDEKILELGLEMVRMTIPDDGVIQDGVVDYILGLLSKSRESPTLIFCGSGARCAIFFAIHRVTRQDMPLEQALVEARRAGMKPDSEAFVRAQVERLAD